MSEVALEEARKPSYDMGFVSKDQSLREVVYRVFNTHFRFFCPKGGSPKLRGRYKPGSEGRSPGAYVPQEIYAAMVRNVAGIARDFDKAPAAPAPMVDEIDLIMNGAPLPAPTPIPAAVHRFAEAHQRPKKKLLPRRRAHFGQMSLSFAR